MTVIKTHVNNVNFGKIAIWYAAVAAVYAIATSTFGSIMVNTIGNTVDPGIGTNLLTGSSWFLILLVSFIQAIIFLLVATGISIGFGFFFYKIYDKLDSTTKATVGKFAKWVAIAISVGAVIFGSTTALIIYKAATFAKLGALATTYVTAYGFITGATNGFIGGTIFAVAITFIGTMFAFLAGMALRTKESAPTAASEEPKDSETPKE